MSDTAELAYQIIHVAADQPLASVTVPAGRSGLAFVVHYREYPVAFFMEALPPGSVLSAAELASKILRHAGPNILSDQIQRQIVDIPGTAHLPDLDIVICTRNRTDLLKRCIQTVVEACAKNVAGRIRIMVVDNAPTDDQTERCVKTLSDVRYIREPTPGLDCARNRALCESTAELIAYIDDDATVDCCWLLGLRAAWRVNPDAGAYVGPVLPLQLETHAQVLFEQAGGFGRRFEPARFGSACADSRIYPYNAAMIGTGCNMVLRRQLVADLGGFDEALDTGEPLPGAGDFDMFYRIVRAGHVVIREPKMVVYHQHRRSYADLRHQMWMWGLTTTAFISKCYRQEPANRTKIRKWVLWWFAYQMSKISARNPRRFDLVTAEIFGGVVGLLGEYGRSRKRMAMRRRRDG